MKVETVTGDVLYNSPDSCRHEQTSQNTDDELHYFNIKYIVAWQLALVALHYQNRETGFKSIIAVSKF